MAMKTSYRNKDNPLRRRKRREARPETCMCLRGAARCMHSTYVLYIHRRSNQKRGVASKENRDSAFRVLTSGFLSLHHPTFFCSAFLLSRHTRAGSRRAKGSLARRRLLRRQPPRVSQDLLPGHRDALAALIFPYFPSFLLDFFWDGMAVPSFDSGEHRAQSARSSYLVGLDA